MEDTVETKPSVSPAVVAFVALFSIGGLLFVGWLSAAQSGITGSAISQLPYYTCCTVEPWGSSAAGYAKGTGTTTTELCNSDELPNRCCVRAGKDRFKSPVRLIDSIVGRCAGPEVSYPSFVGAPQSSYSACCTTQTWRYGPTGLLQGVAATSTEYCLAAESPNTCCSRAGASKSDRGVRLIGAKIGGCAPPQTSYPAPIASGYSACCSAATWQQSPTGYTQGESAKTTGYCDSLESLSQCCVRVLGQTMDKPFRLLGFKQGSCSSGPEVSYPIWIR